MRAAGLSLFAVGGASATVPAIRAYVVGAGLVDAPTFARIFAWGQIAPGPNILYVPLVGYVLGGVAGALITLVAFVTPPALLSVSVDRFFRRRAHAPAIAVLRRAFRPIAGGVLLGSGLLLIATFSHGRPLPVAVAAATIAVVLAANVGVLWCLGGAAVVGLVAALIAH